jgi:hypothetical protein
MTKISAGLTIKQFEVRLMKNLFGGNAPYLLRCSSGITILEVSCKGILMASTR